MTRVGCGSDSGSDGSEEPDGARLGAVAMRVAVEEGGRRKNKNEKKCSRGRDEDDHKN